MGSYSLVVKALRGAIATHNRRDWQTKEDWDEEHQVLKDLLKQYEEET